ncbi:unnamed protein product [Bursaphelenchus xylophilus]|uniref:(pine wood nematode) hypothetical protein n=1 Tax=Bursaphelenchus xylophilus TaxID=6326 RepID=A0A1I7RQ78_BURXY|nr:unnamed protein product [Bursaphelenchus xylophilus]CAG9097281.1 unnamed protein product [Bursaphelenchus xylophilus]
MSNVEKEEGEIQSESEENNDDFSIEEQRIDQVREEFYRAREEIMRSKSRRNSHKKEKKNRKGDRESRARPSTSSKDNYEVVNMEIESPPDHDSIDEEERALREMLLEQVMTKRGKVKRSNANTTTTPSSRPEVVDKTNDKDKHPISTTQQRLRPPLSPPADFLLPPPPIPPMDLIMIDETSNLSDYEPYSPKPPDHPIINESQEGILGRELNEQLQQDGFVNNLFQEDSPKSPDEVSDDVLTSELEDSDDDAFDDELSEFELDLDDVREENKSTKRELNRLQKRHKQNQNDYNAVRKTVEKLKEELAEQERKLLVYAERGMDLTERITNLIEKSYNSSNKHLNSVKEERQKWKNKVNKTAMDTKQRLKNRFKRVFKGRIQKPKKIPLVDISVQKSRPTKETKKKSPKTPVNPPGNNTYENVPSIVTHDHQVTSSQQDYGNDVITSSTELSVDIEEIMPGASDSRSIESQLLERLMKKSKSKSRTTPPTKQNGKSKNNIETQQNPQDLMIEEIVDDPRPSSSTSLDDALRNPLTYMRSYRLYPFFPFQHINHPAVSNKLKADVPICPYELHGVCRDDTCKWQHDQDMRVSEVDIIKEMISYYPSLCPPTKTIDQYAKELLSKGKVADVARSVASSIPPQVRERCFNDELKKFIAL